MSRGRARKGGTRAKIQEIALELFAEQGYEKTSLREIAERLGVTKAALYYHFRTKEDIVAQPVRRLPARQVDEIIDWAQAQPMDDERPQGGRAPLLGCHHGSSPGVAMIQFMQGNQSTMRELRDSKQMFERFRALTGVITGGNTSLAGELRSVIALFSLHIGAAGPFELSGTIDERRAAALEIACDLVSDQPNRSSTSSAGEPEVGQLVAVCRALPAGRCSPRAAPPWRPAASLRSRPKCVVDRLDGAERVGHQVGVGARRRTVPGRAGPGRR